MKIKKYVQGLFLQGKNIYLRTLSIDDVHGNYTNWLNDPIVCKYNRHARFPSTKESMVQYLEKISQSTTIIVLAIAEKKSHKHIGDISLSSINWIDRNAELSIIIGEKEVWGKGYGTEACRLMIGYAFQILNLHRVYAGTHEENISFQNIAKKLKMKIEGRSIKNVYKNSKYSDTIWYYAINPHHS